VLDVLFAANLNRIFSAVALKALEVYAIPTPWRPQDTTTISRYGAYESGLAVHEGEGAGSEAPGVPRPAYGHSKDGRPDLNQVVLSLGGSGEGGLPRRLGIRDGNTSDSPEGPVACEECLALGLEGVIGIVADSKTYSQRPLGLWVEKQMGLVTRVPRTCGIRQELETWGQQHAPLPLWVDTPGPTQGAPTALAGSEGGTGCSSGICRWPDGAKDVAMCRGPFSSVSRTPRPGICHRSGQRGQAGR
jgi:hypothetical protein